MFHNLSYRWLEMEKLGMHLNATNGQIEFHKTATGRCNKLILCSLNCQENVFIFNVAFPHQAKKAIFESSINSTKKISLKNSI